MLGRYFFSEKSWQEDKQIGMRDEGRKIEKNKHGNGVMEISATENKDNTKGKKINYNNTHSNGNDNNFHVKHGNSINNVNANANANAKSSLDDAASYAPPHTILKFINPDEEAGKLGIYHRYAVERAAAHCADVFTCVSWVVAFEAENLIQRKPGK